MKTVQRIESLSQEQLDAIPAWNEQTIREIMSLEPVDMPVFMDALARCVKFANLPVPKVVLAASPLEAWRIFSMAATRDATWAATRAATMAATRAATEAATWDATMDATWGATWAATGDATMAATRAATEAATWDATRDATMDATRAATRAAKISFDYSFWSGGREWLSYIRFLLFFRDVCYLRLPKGVWDKGQAYYDLLRSAGSCILHARDLVVVSQPPLRREARFVNGRQQLHQDGRAAVEYRDGFSLFYLNGVAMPRWVVETPARELDITKGLAITNAQQRAEFVKKVGIERVMQVMGPKVIHREAIVIGDVSHPYELLELTVGEITGRWLKMVNPSVPGLYHVEPVRGRPRTVREALHVRKPDWMQQIPVDDMHGLEWYQQGDVYIVPDGATSLKSLPTVLT